MSGLFALWQRDGAPVEGGAVEGVMTALAHRAIDGRSVRSVGCGSAVLGHLHFWTTPEELGEEQPLMSGDVALVFDGRLDNRAALASALGVSAEGEAALEMSAADTAALGLSTLNDTALSDAALALLAYRRWGDDFVARLGGPFAVVVWDGYDRRVVCARDALGRRSLFYRLTDRVLVVASEPGAVLAACGADGANATLDEVFLAHYFAVRPAPDGRTLFESVKELPPAHTLVVDEAVACRERYWAPRLAPIRYGSDDQYYEHFVELLDRAVQRRMRAPVVPGVMMSGGMDSPSVAALAARRLAHEAPGQPLKVYSYVFDELSDLDERPWMQPMVDRYGLDQTLVTADDAWPLSDVEAWPWNPGGPDTGPFRALNARLYAAARQDGRRVLLTGAASDSFFIAGRTSWLSDLVADGRYAEATTEVLRHVRALGPLRVLGSGSMRRLIGERVTPGRPARPLPPPRWLTPDAAEIVQQSAQADSGMNGRSGIGSRLGSDTPSGIDLHLRTVPPRRPGDAQAVWESLNASDGMDAGYFNHQAQVEVRDPYSDLELVEFAMSIPAYALYNRGTDKYLLRRSMGEALPPEILSRRHRSDISPLYWRGMGQKGAATVRQLLNRPGAAWHRYVKPDAFRQATDGWTTHGAMSLLVWQCVSLEWWLSRGQGTEMASVQVQDNPEWPRPSSRSI